MKSIRNSKLTLRTRFISVPKGAQLIIKSIVLIICMSAFLRCGTSPDDVVDPTIPPVLPGFTYKATLNGHWCYLSEATLSWKTAQLEAEKTPGHLVTITSSEENALIASMLDSVAYFSLFGWLGLTDEEEEGLLRSFRNRQLTLEPLF